MQHYLVFLLVAFSVFNSSAKDGGYFFEKISPESGFAFDAVYTIAEDCNGLVWFGCNNGLYHYNTHEIEKILLYPNNSPTPQAVKVNRIIKDAECTMWICTDLGLYSLKPNQNEIVQVPFSTEALDLHNQSVEDILHWDSTTYLVVINKTIFEFNSVDYSFIEVKNIEYPIRNQVSFLGRGLNDELLIGTSNGHVYTARNGIFSEYTLLYNDTGSVVKSICVNGDSYLIGYEGKGVIVINDTGKMIEKYHEQATGNYRLPSNRVRQIVRRENGQIWIGTYGGILIISQGNRTIIKKDEDNGLPYNSVYVIYQGLNGGIWIGTWAGGIAYYNDHNYRFQHIRKAGETSIGDRSIASSFIEDAANNIWIGSEDGGLSFYNPNQSYFDEAFLERNTEQLARIKNLYTSDGINIFIGTFDMGFWHFNKSKSTIKKINLGTNINEHIYSSCTQIGNELWIGTRTGGVFRYNLVTHESERIHPGRLYPEYTSSSWVWKTYKDSKNRLWVCTDHGLYVKSEENNDFMACFQNDTIHGLDKHMIYTIFEDNNGNYWVGTKGKGLFTYHHELDEIKPFIHNSLIATSDIYSILGDDNNNIWFSTNVGLYLFDTNTEILERFSVKDGLSGDQYIPNSAIKASDGKLYFGSANGFNIIDPKQIRKNPVAPQVFLTKFLVNNHPYEIEPGVRANKFYLPFIREMKLKYNNNSLTFGFASNGFIKPSSNKFKYRLTNYMEDWTVIENGRDIVFTKIPTGFYTLEVLGSNNDNVWSDQALRIPIRILPPFWFAWYAYLIYIIIGSVIMYLIYKESKTRLKMRKDFLAERYKNEASQTIHDEKIRFFTNISHEFRTPLTLIVSPINNLLGKFQFDLTTTKQLKVIKRNAERLSRLTNQILDFRLLEAGQIITKPSKIDVVEICTNIIDCFEFQITEKKINFIFTSDYKSIWVMADPEMTEKIIYNLLSNSFKFSKDKGQILFSIEKKEISANSYDGYVSIGNQFLGEAVEIKIRDFGIGIAPEVLPTIFERFSKAPNNNKVGSGIGLHMCQEYAKLNNANIMVSSEPGKGSTFILNMPYKKCSWNKKESFIIQPHYDKLEKNDAKVYENNATADNNTVVLVVEDNDDLRIYLKNFLSTHFRVLTAKNGTQGLEIALEVIPNIILTDIMMPGIDGLELTEAIKSNKKTNFIPVIILTAMSESEYQKQGLLKGADSFLVKPIDESVLMAQILNILNNRQSLKRLFDQANENPGGNTGLSQPSFIEHAEKIVMAHLQLPDFNISELASQLNVSNSSLHRKIKAAVNQSPTEFIRDIRLKKAIVLMKDNNYNIDEISIYVGFNSTSYFMRSFKRKYGKTPKDYRRTIQEPA